MGRGILIATITATNAVFLFAIQWFVVTRIGTGISTDVLFSSTVILSLIGNIFSGSIVYVLVPVLTVSSEKKARELVWSVGIALVSILALVSFLLGATVSAWVHWIVPGFSAAEAAQTAQLTRIQLVGVTFTGASSVLTAAYNARHKFIFPAVTTVLSSLISLAIAITTVQSWGVTGAALAMTARPIALFGLQIAVALPFSLPDFRSEEFRRVARGLIPLAAGSAYFKTDQLVDRMLASMAPAGILSVLHLAQQLYAGVNQMVIAGLVAPAVPRLALIADYESREFKAAVGRLLAQLLLVGGALYAAVIFPGKIALAAIFAHGSFRSGDIDRLWVLMLALGLWWMAGLTGQVFSNTFYICGDTKTPTRVGVVGFTIGILLKIVGFWGFGVVGVALASGIYSTGNSVVMLRILRRRLDW